LVKSWNRDTGEITISAVWLPKNNFNAVPLPLPTNSSAALALYLFLRSVNTSVMNKIPIDMKALRDRLGISKRWVQSQVNRAIDRALTAVNRHYKQAFDDEDLETLEDLKVHVPGGYEIKVHDGGRRIRFQDFAHPYYQRMATHDSYTAAPTKKSGPGRVAVAYDPMNPTAMGSRPRRRSVRRVAETAQSRPSLQVVAALPTTNEAGESCKVYLLSNGQHGYRHELADMEIDWGRWGDEPAPR
jgi:hypothetical protein